MSGVVRGQVVDTGVAAAVHVVGRVVQNEEHQQVHRAQVKQHETVGRK